MVQVANAVNQTQPMRALMENTLHVDRNAWLPALATRKFRSAAPKAAEPPVKDGQRTPGKVAIFATCYVNYNEPGIGMDLLKVLAHNEVPYVLVEKEQCCGMPKLELGDLDAVDASKRANIPVLAKYAREGWAILAAVPSCTLMFKQEIPLMYPDDAEVQAVKEAMWDPSSTRRAPSRRAAEDRVSAAGQGELPDPRHQRVQNIGRKTEELLKMVPGTSVHTNERCSATPAPRREEAVPRGRDEDRQAAVQAHGRAPAGRRARLHQLRLRAGRPPHRPGLRPQQLGAPRLEHLISLLRIAYGLK